MLAYRLGCKGITIYRDGSRESQVLQVDKKVKDSREKRDVSFSESGGISSSAPDEKMLPKSGQKLKNISSGDEETEEIINVKSYIRPRPRPETTKGLTRKYNIGGCGKLYVTVNSDEIGICEVFTSTGEEGCAALSEAISRLISITIRSGIEIDAILKQISGIRCITCIADDKTHVLSCPDAIGKAIEYYIKGYNKFDLNIS